MLTQIEHINSLKAALRKCYKLELKQSSELIFDSIPTDAYTKDEFIFHSPIHNINLDDETSNGLKMACLEDGWIVKDIYQYCTSTQLPMYLPVDEINNFDRATYHGFVAVPDESHIENISYFLSDYTQYMNSETEEVWTLEDNLLGYISTHYDKEEGEDNYKAQQRKFEDLINGILRF